MTCVEELPESRATSQYSCCQAAETSIAPIIIVETYKYIRQGAYIASPVVEVRVKCSPCTPRNLDVVFSNLCAHVVAFLVLCRRAMEVNGTLAGALPARAAECSGPLKFSVATIAFLPFRSTRFGPSSAACIVPS